MHNHLTYECLSLLFALGDSLLMTMMIMMMTLVYRTVDVVDRFVMGASYQPWWSAVQVKQKQRTDSQNTTTAPQSFATAFLVGMFPSSSARPCMCCVTLLSTIGKYSRLTRSCVIVIVSHARVFCLFFGLRSTKRRRLFALLISRL